MKKLLLILATLSIFSCKKSDPTPPPVSCFTLSSSTIMEGESVHIVDCSTGSGTYTIIGNEISNNSMHEFTYPDAGSYLIQLSINNAAGSSTATQTLTVVPATGSAVFWFGTGTHYNTTVIINGIQRSITSSFLSAPYCGQAGSANFDLPIGTYNFSATDGYSTWSGSVAITTRGCTKKQLL